MHCVVSRPITARLTQFSHMPDKDMITTGQDCPTPYAMLCCDSPLCCCAGLAITTLKMRCLCAQGLDLSNKQRTPRLGLRAGALDLPLQASRTSSHDLDMAHSPTLPGGHPHTRCPLLPIVPLTVWRFFCWLYAAYHLALGCHLPASYAMLAAIICFCPHSTHLQLALLALFGILFFFIKKA